MVFDVYQQERGRMSVEVVYTFKAPTVKFYDTPPGGGLLGGIPNEFYFTPCE